jgi:hypothetical protein
MPEWVENSLIVTSKAWQFSQAIQGDYIRVVHAFMNPPDLFNPNWIPYGFKGLIAQAEYNPFILMGVTTLFPIFDSEGVIFFFPVTPAIEDRRIAIKGQTKYERAPIEWRVTIYELGV